MSKCRLIIWKHQKGKRRLKETAGNGSNEDMIQGYETENQNSTRFQKISKLELESYILFLKWIVVKFVIHWLFAVFPHHYSILRAFGTLKRTHIHHLTPSHRVKSTQFDVFLHITTNTFIFVIIMGYTCFFWNKNFSYITS